MGDGHELIVPASECEALNAAEGSGAERSGAWADS
jgi:hypothetical protein